MKIIIALNHPAHYYLFKYIRQGLVRDNHEVQFVIREKDILEKLLISENVSYTKLSEKKLLSNNKVAVMLYGITKLVKQEYNLFQYVRKFRPNIMMGTDIAITHVGTLLGIPSFVFNEDDFEINKWFCKASYPLASYIVAPECTSVGSFSRKKISYNGIQKLAYLHPNYFHQDISVFNTLGLAPDDSYFIIRLVSLTAGHDIDSIHKGIHRSLLIKIINKLQPFGKVFISSEIKLADDLLKYQINLPPNKIHDLLASAQLFIGDSQSMCSEAGILGTPFIRFNDFVGRIKILNEIEHDYQLGFGIKTSEEDKLFSTIDELLNTKNLKSIWQEKTAKLFKDKIDLTAFVIWFVENYPESTSIMKNDPDYQYRFQ